MPTTPLLEKVQQAVTQKKLTPSAVEHIRDWLTKPHYAEYSQQVAEHIEAEKWQELDDAFWTIIPFGTGGRRGRMYPIGSNAINDRTIGESAQGLADYSKQHWDNTKSLSQNPVKGCQRPENPEQPDSFGTCSKELRCAIAYDTRHRSEHFARLCAEVMVAAGYRVYFLQGHRSTPELSFTVRSYDCACGIMVTASHNPPSDNAVKAYWSTGGQLLPPHDKGVIDQVMAVEAILRTPFDEALADGRIVRCQEAMDTEFVAAVSSLATPGPRDLKVLYSPLHGVGATAVCPVLEKAGFQEVEVFALHATPDGDFPNVPGNVSNPENPEVFESITAHAKQINADLAMASDPDCDRIGCSAPLVFSEGAPWDILTGNQIGALLTDYVLETRKEQRTLTPENFIVITLVTTQLIRRITRSYGARLCGNLLVGFKWIAQVMDDEGPEDFLFGAEESYGYLAGNHVRDKDGAVSAMLLCELAAKLKAEGITLHEKLDALFWQHGAHQERTISVQMPGSEGMARMQEVMGQFREQPPKELAGSAVAQSRDYLRQKTVLADGSQQPLDGPVGDLVILDLAAEGNYVAIRPSGTEPKIKLYMFTFEPPEQIANLDDTKAALSQRLDRIEADLRTAAGV